MYKNYIGVHLFHEGPSVEVQYELRLRWKDSDFVAASTLNSQIFNDNEYGDARLLPIKQFHNKAIVECTITSPGEGVCHMSEELMASIRAQYQAELFTDFTLLVNDYAIRVHRWVLASCSPVFKAMMLSGMQESRFNEAVISDISVDAVRCFLSVVYMAKNHVYSLKVKLEVLLMADKYDAKLVTETMINEISAAVNSENCLEVLEKAEMISCTELKETTTRYIRANARRCGRRTRPL